MAEILPLDVKIIKQVEYYFGDLNLSRDKFMKEAISENDGWIPFETMLKFNRLKSLSEDISVIKDALSKSTSGLLEVGPKGIRRCQDHVVPATFEEAFEGFRDRSVYVKGFPQDLTLDAIIEWLESHGGKTLNVHMRRYPKTKKFKGSIFATFEKKEDVDAFLTSEMAAEYNGTTVLRLLRDDYWKSKETEKNSKMLNKVKKAAASEARITSRMVPAALLELSGLPKIEKQQDQIDNSKSFVPESTTEESKVENESENATNGTQSEKAASDQEGMGEEQQPEGSGDGLTVLNLKQWLSEKLGEAYQVSWIDVYPAEGKAIIRFKEPETSSSAWSRLTALFGTEPVTYMGSVLSGRTLSGDEEKQHWVTIFAARQNKAQKRRSRGRPYGGPSAGPKRRR